MQRQEYYSLFPEFMTKMVELGQAAKASGLDRNLLNLVNVRASQVNGCGFCVDMHSKEAKIDGERELRLYHVPVWRESPLFSDTEKAALLWTEAVTRLSEGEVSDEAYARARKHFSEKELVQLTASVVAINAWNRFAATFRTVPGSQDRAFGLEKAGL